MSMVFDTPEGIEFFQLVARRGALKMETLGMKRRGQSAYSICKEAYGLKGSRENVLSQMDAMIERKQAARRASQELTSVESQRRAEEHERSVGYRP